MTTIPSTTVALTVTDAFHPSESELDFVVRTFNVRFSDWRGKRIVLHGTREYARAIVESFDEAYRFAAVVADGFANATFAGKDVWTDRQLVEEKPDLVILTERVRHAEAVYQEIGTKCRETGIALFDMYGLDWLAMRDEIDGQGAHTLEEWVDIAAPYDIVSFEVPDCLMMPNSQDADVPLICQPSMRKLIKRIVAQGKQALFVGRKPYTAEEQIESLIASGLISRREDAQDLFFMRANEDGAWRTIRAAYPDARILHVGYGIPKECVLPRYYGVDTYRMAYDSETSAHTEGAFEQLIAQRLFLADAAASNGQRSFRSISSIHCSYARRLCPTMCSRSSNNARWKSGCQRRGSPQLAWQPNIALMAIQLRVSTKQCSMPLAAAMPNVKSSIV